MSLSDAPEAAAQDARITWSLPRPALGISLGGTHSAEQAHQHARWVALAETLGMHSVWVPEMHFASGVCAAPLVELASYIAQTTKIRLGTTSLLLPLHPPDELAAEIAALDRISEGRLLIGLGRGFQKKMLEAFGVDPATKRDRFDANLDRMLELWSEANRTGGGLATWQQPHPPLAVAAFGPKALAQAARRALPYLASPIESTDQIEENQTRHRELLPESSPAPLSLVMRTVFVSSSQSEVDAAKESLEREFSRRAAPRMPAAIGRAMESPLEARAVLGDVDAVTQRLRADRERLGIDLLIVRPAIGGIDLASQEKSLKMLVGEVWPKVLL